MDQVTVNLFGACTYLLGAVAFGLLGGLMLVSWRGQRQGLWLIGAAGTTMLRAAVLSWGSYANSLTSLSLLAVEAACDFAWILALTSLSGTAISRRVRVACLGGVIAIGAFALAAWFLELRAVAYLDPMRLLSRTQLASSLLGLVLLEQLYRNTTPSGRHNLKFFVIGVGLLFGYDIFLFSQTELIGGLSLESWNARGIVAMLAVPLVAVSAQRMPHWSIDVFVSRQVVFYTATFMITGAYLVVIALGGFYVREFGGDWGSVGQLVFVAGATVSLAGILTSPNLRRQARVFISKHFYRNKYDYRVEWLRFIETLSSANETDIRASAIHAIAQIFSSPGGYLFWREESGRRFDAAASWPAKLDPAQMPESISASSDLANFFSRTKWIIDLRELRNEPGVYGNLDLPEWVLQRGELRIVSPLFLSNDLAGILFLAEPPAPFDLTYEDRDLLHTVGRHVATHIAQQDADKKLAENRQFEAYNRLTAFMMHDLKNSIAQLKLVVENAARHKHKPEFIDDAIGTVANAVERMTRLIEQLRSDRPIERVTSVRLSECARQVALRCSNRAPSVVFEAEHDPVVRADHERLSMVIEHIVRNAQDATRADGTVSISVGRRGALATVNVSDTGAGMSPQFIRERLFRPFDSTKGAKGMGIGAYQTREYVRSLGGDVEVQSTPGLGTTFTVILPCIEPSDRADVSESAEIEA